jgi:hypothetical protein
MSIQDLLEAELARFDAEHPRPRELAMDARMSLLGAAARSRHIPVTGPGPSR